MKNRYISVEVAAKARAARVAEAKRVNPSFNAPTTAVMGSPGTTALYLLTLWDGKADAAPKNWVRAFFEEDRIPYREGYRKPKVAITSDDLTKLTNRVNAVPV
ncbi:Chloroperoxidase [Penicillium paradoxum]|uniref:Chloroperoxidase n=1 Tax=Penicillium paradoxum TaxID=176176 RepID=UPI00254658AA|nr:Chloroperoxidase [Penicillium paradoxum]KAJ5783221.1 Chloroperoxidase [Penicillium paradoxum]